MSRFKYQSFAKDGNGSVISGATVSVYLAGTTTAADVYTASSGGTAVNSVTSGTDGYFYFWVDDGDYTGEQFFDLSVSKSNFGTKSIANIEVLPLLYAGSGTTANRPTVTTVGMYYVDTDLGQVVFWDGSSWTLFTLEADPNPKLANDLDLDSNGIIYDTGGNSVTAQEIGRLDGTDFNIKTEVDGKIPYTGTAQVPWTKGADVASASALPILTDGNYFDVTGVTSVTSINTTGQIGTVIKLHFDGILTLTHHATDLILPGGANITTAAGDEAEFVEYASGKWRCTSYQTAIATPTDPDSLIKAWINFNGTGTIAINDSYNVASITDNGAGDYTITWDTDFADTNYSYTITCGGGIAVGTTTTKATGSLRIKIYNFSSILVDINDISVIAIGSQ